MLTVRPSTYRGKPGWLVSGKKPGEETRVRVFALHRSAALHIRDRLTKGLHINALDFQPRDTE